MKKTALITGASSGIGLACAELLAAQGYDLILTARREERLKEIESQLTTTHHIFIETLCLDVRDKAQVNDVLGKIEAPDVLINNAGLALGLSHFYAGDTDQWDTMIDTNIKGLLFVSRTMAEKMIARGTGHIVNIGSIAGKEVYENGNVYCASKHAVDALTRGMRIELASKGIKVTGIHPGAVETEFSIVRFGGDAERAKKVYEGFENLVAADIADAVVWAVTRPEHVNINDIIIMPKAQPAAGVIHRKTS
ncbi:MAG: SDR family NAD(P)-dependent oxidoreductase [Sphingomonadales bacterium]|nr:SDR family NAD(P)-dependent oxidoreductase [Sphingomonadales bacterium]